MKQQQGAELHSFDVQLPGPLDIPASLEVFRRWGDDGLDRWDGRVLLRTTRVEGQPVPFACTMTGTVDAPGVTLMVASPAHAPAIASVVRGKPQPVMVAAAASGVAPTAAAGEFMAK